MLDIHSCGVLLSCMWYTKRLLICPYLCSSLVVMLIYSCPSSSLRCTDPSDDIGFLSFAGIPIEPLPMSKNSIFIMGISSVVAVS
jgi:hypothetical protein